MKDKQPDIEKAEKVLARITEAGGSFVTGSLLHINERETQKFLVQFIEEFDLDLNCPFTHQFRKLLGRELLRDEQYALDMLYRIVHDLRSVDGPPQPGWLRRLK